VHVSAIGKWEESTEADLEEETQRTVPEGSDRMA